jgi:hypothetical protein
VSAEIIQFVPRPNRRGHLAEFAAPARSIFGADDLTMDHADTAPCEYVVSGCEMREDSEQTS